MQFPYAGWAADAHAEMTSDDLSSMVKRMMDHSANLLWIGHNNPGEVDPQKCEPAISYAVYESFIDPQSRLHEGAKAMVEAQFRLLNACRELGMPVVFPIGYQIQMGRLWNERHPSELRRDPEGNVIDWGGVSASHYSEVYREDIMTFYRWAAETFVNPYSDVIIMVNLADEPFGGDYSPPAEKVFRERHGLGFDEVGHDPARIRLLGEFQSDYIVEYAIWSAEAWGRVCPDVPCTMTFCGWHGRLGNSHPTIPRLFSETPANFHVTFDAYPRDGAPTNVIAETDVTSLIAFLKQIGRLSRRYDKPLWLWSTGNSWGLGQASEDKADIADAVANQLHLAMVSVDAGARLAGIAVWNYNVKSQGLYLDTNPIVYDPDDMFRKVSATFPVLREICRMGKTSAEEILLHTPVEYLFDEAGRSRALYTSKLYDLESVSILAKNDLKFNIASDLRDTDGIRTMICLAPEEDYFTPEAAETARSVVRDGGKFVGRRELVRFMFGDAAADAPVICQGDEELPDVRKFILDNGEVYTVSGQIERTLDDRLDCHYARFWKDCLGVERASRAYLTSNGTRKLAYNISRRVSTLPADEDWAVFDRHLASDKDAESQLSHHEIAVQNICFRDLEP